MIVIGYQGIGKSSLGKQDLRFIDLESSSFWVNGQRASDWYIPYCQVAEHLSKQGYVVFTSSHEVVRNYLKQSSERVICCVPAPDLKGCWINRLADRYKESGLEKDYKAYMNALDRYEANVREILSSGYETVVIESADYSLKQLIEDAM